MRYLISASALLLVASCAQPEQPTAPEAAAEPGLRFVGEPEAGARLMKYVEADGMNATASFDGRDQGLAAFCTGQADAVALTTDLSDTERATCKQGGVSWSALSGLGTDAPILYIRYDIANEFVAESSGYN